MSWLIKRFKDGKVGIWSTITDSYLTEPVKLSRKQAIRFIKDNWKEKLKKRLRSLKKHFLLVTAIKIPIREFNII